MEGVGSGSMEDERWVDGSNSCNPKVVEQSPCTTHRIFVPTSDHGQSIRVSSKPPFSNLPSLSVARFWKRLKKGFK
jgi:hypothetical protein